MVLLSKLAASQHKKEQLLTTITAIDRTLSTSDNDINMSNTTSMELEMETSQDTNININTNANANTNDMLMESIQATNNKIHARIAQTQEDLAVSFMTLQ